MFVSKRKYGELDARHIALLKKHDNLKDKWDNLVTRINDKGGESFLNSSNEQQFSKGEIKQLLFLCHPDKHANNSTATELTVKLLELRRKL